MNGVPIAPPSEVRDMAHLIRQLYDALLLEGFTTDEAMTMTAKVFAERAGVANRGET